MRTGRKISVRNCPNESRLQNYTVLSSPRVMLTRFKAIKIAPIASLSGRAYTLVSRIPRVFMND